MGRNQPRQDGKMRYLDAQVEEEERTTDGLVDPSFKEAAGRSEIISN